MVYDFQTIMSPLCNEDTKHICCSWCPCYIVNRNLYICCIHLLLLCLKFIVCFCWDRDRDWHWFELNIADNLIKNFQYSCSRNKDTNCWNPYVTTDTRPNDPGDFCRHTTVCMVAVGPALNTHFTKKPLFLHLTLITTWFYSSRHIYGTHFGNL